MTTDEAMFNFGGSYGRRRVSYTCKGHSDYSKLKCVKSDSFAQGFLAWALVSFHSKIEAPIIPKDVEVNLQFYIGKTLTPFIKHY